MNQGVSAWRRIASGTPCQPVPLTTAAWIFFCSSMRAWRSSGGSFMPSSTRSCCWRIRSAPFDPPVSSVVTPLIDLSRVAAISAAAPPSARPATTIRRESTSSRFFSHRTAALTSSA